ncbi:hypothetical protein ACVITL_006742 [Rhizobium pisi]
MPIEIWFADEARIGQKNKITRRWVKRGTRPSAPHDQRAKSPYIFGAICPQKGKAAGLVLPFCNADTMNLHLAEISLAVAPEAHAVVLMDQAGWHLTPSSMLSNRVFASYDEIIWVTGPELLISTKRMDSSYGKNAPNRIEESYGDAKHLRLRHPLAALGFLFGLRSDILEKEPKTAEWLFDLLSKLGREDDAYHSTCLVLMEYSTDQILPAADEEEPSDGILETGPQPIMEPEEGEIAHLAESTVKSIVKALPKVSILEKRTPDDLSPARFLTSLVTRVLATTPVNMHGEARRRRASI